MTARKVNVTFTPTEADALLRLAACAADTWEDAEAVLDEPNTHARTQAVRAGYRAIEKLNAATPRRRSPR